MALKKSLRTLCNRQLTSAILLVYETLGVYMYMYIQEACMDFRVLIACSENVAPSCALSKSTVVGYLLKLKDGESDVKRALHLSGEAAKIIAELLFLCLSEVWTSVRAAEAAFLSSYVNTAQDPNFSRRQRTEAHSGVFRCKRDELQELKAGDVNLS